MAEHNGEADVIDQLPLAGGGSSPPAVPVPPSAPSRAPIRVDISGLTFGDLVTLEKLEQGDGRSISAVDMLAFLNRVVIGGVDNLSITRAREIMVAVQRAVKESANPND